MFSGQLLLSNNRGPGFESQAATPYISTEADCVTTSVVAEWPGSELAAASGKGFTRRMLKGGSSNPIVHICSIEAGLLNLSVSADSVVQRSAAAIGSYSRQVMYFSTTARQSVDLNTTPYITCGQNISPSA